MRKPGRCSRIALDRLVADTIWALSVEVSFGRAVALGYAELVGEVPAERLETYHSYGCRMPATQALRWAGSWRSACRRCWCTATGRRSADSTGLGRHGAQRRPHAAWSRFWPSGPCWPAANGRRPGVYLELLHTLFAADLSYEEVRYFSVALPKAVRRLAPQRRYVAAEGASRRRPPDRRLVEPFLTGLSRGLGLLREDALRNFVAGALLTSPARAASTAPGRSRWNPWRRRSASAPCRSSVGFAQVQDRLRRYLHARTGLALSIRPLSALAAAEAAALGPGRMVCSDAQAIYLPDEIDQFDDKEQNAELYRLLVRLEACFHEFGTFDFDGEKALEACRAVIGRRLPEPAGCSSRGDPTSRLLSVYFPDPVLAADLFTIFELGRIRKCLEQTYGGLVRRFYPVLRDAFSPPEGFQVPADPLPRLLARVALGVPGGDGDALVEEIAVAFDADISAASPVEASAVMTAALFRDGQKRTVSRPAGGRPWQPHSAGDPGRIPRQPAKAAPRIGWLKKSGRPSPWMD